MVNIVRDLNGEVKADNMEVINIPIQSAQVPEPEKSNLKKVSGIICFR